MASRKPHARLPSPLGVRARDSRRVSRLRHGHRGLPELSLALATRTIKWLATAILSLSLIRSRHTRAATAPCRPRRSPAPTTLPTTTTTAEPHPRPWRRARAPSPRDPRRRAGALRPRRAEPRPRDAVVRTPWPRHASPSPRPRPGAPSHAASEPPDALSFDRVHVLATVTRSPRRPRPRHHRPRPADARRAEPPRRRVGLAFNAPATPTQCCTWRPRPRPRLRAQHRLVQDAVLSAITSSRGRLCQARAPVSTRTNSAVAGSARSPPRQAPLPRTPTSRADAAPVVTTTTLPRRSR